MISNQQFFEKTIDHLVAQGRPAVVPDGIDGGSCMYRTPEGLKCAAGVHIPDELYSPIMEGKAIYSVVTPFSKLNRYFPDISLATELQRLHDAMSGNWDDTGFIAWGEVRNIAARYNLDVRPDWPIA